MSETYSRPIEVNKAPTGLGGSNRGQIEGLILAYSQRVRHAGLDPASSSVDV